MISEEKQTFRLRVLDSLRALSDADRAAKSLLIARFLQRRLGESPGVVFGFSPLRLEPDWTSALHPSWVLALPRIEGTGLHFHRVRDLAELHRGPFGTREPAGGEVVPVSDVSVVLVPGLAFDRQGARLGRGGGFYDRLLEQAPKTARRIAVCFGCQVAERVPVEPHDAEIDEIVTEDGWIEMRSSGPDRD